MATFTRGPERIEIAIVDRAVVTRTYRGDELVDEVVQQASSVLKAKWDADRLGRDRVAAGFTRVGGEPAAPSQDELVAALAASPDDLDTYLVYADWLSERGEPWGQLIAIQHALETLPRRAFERRSELSHEETKLLFQHGAKFWGPLGETIVNESTQTYASDAVGAVWRCGFVRAIATDTRAEGIQGLFGKLARLDIMRLLEKISITASDWRNGMLADLGAVTWPYVRELAIATEYREPDRLALDAARLATFVDGTVLPKLVDLIVLESRNTDALCHAIAASPIAAQLRSIVLYRGGFTEAGIGALARARFGALDRLALSGAGPNSAAMTLRSVAKHVVIELREPGEEYEADY